ncbi:hypothetical protein D3C76_1208840 [compost metagenome]
MVDAVHLLQGFITAREQRRKLGGIQRTAATQSDDAFGATGFGDIHRGQDDRLRWVGLYLRKHGHGYTVGFKAAEHRIQQPGGHDAGVGHQQHRGTAHGFDLDGEPGRSTRFDDHRGSGLKHHFQHESLTN